jgi:hypothetical protein
VQHGFQFFVNLMTFFQQKKVIEYSLFIFISHICAKFLTQKRKLIITCLFEFFQSHCHILKELHEFSHMMDAIITFEKSILISSFVGYGLVTKSVDFRAHLRTL